MPPVMNTAKSAIATATRVTAMVTRVVAKATGSNDPYYPIRLKQNVNKYRDLRRTGIMEVYLL